MNDYSFSVRDEGLAVASGGPYDMTRCYAPNALQKKDGGILLYYTGSNTDINLHTNYKLLCATSTHDRVFSKHPKPVLDIPDEFVKVYSSLTMQHGNTFRLYFALNTGDGYRIRLVESRDPLHFEGLGDVVIDKDEALFSWHVHTPKIVERAGGGYHCYVAGTSDKGKFESSIGPGHMVTAGVRLFYGTSDDGIRFSSFQPLAIDLTGFRTVHGHSVMIEDGVVYLIFTGVNEHKSAMYIAHSEDGVHFSKPRVLAHPNTERGEIAKYSTSVIRIAPYTYTLFYGSRGIDTYLGIRTATLLIKPGS